MRLVSFDRPKGSSESQLSAFSTTPGHRHSFAHSFAASGKERSCPLGHEAEFAQVPGVNPALETLPSFDEHYSSYLPSQRTIAQCNDRGSVSFRTSLGATWGLFNHLERSLRNVE